MTAHSDKTETATATTTAKGQALRESIGTARTQAAEAAHTAIERTKDQIDHARSTVAEAYSTAREKARAAGKTATDGLESNPMTALIGGLAIGAVIGALLPRTEREAKALGAVGGKLQDAARDAVDAAKDAGREKLAEFGLSREHARDTMKSLLDGAIAAATSAGAAAVDSARKAPASGDDKS